LLGIIAVAAGTAELLGQRQLDSERAIERRRLAVTAARKLVDRKWEDNKIAVEQ
jgi:hypothetical protein